MKILVAVNNKDIYKKIKEEFKEDVYKYDIDLKENVIELLSKTKEEYTLITKDSLEGSIDKKLYIKQIKFANPSTNVIYLVEKLDNEYKEFLFANEVFNIFEGEKIDINEIIKSIKENNKIVYKNNVELNEAAEKYKINNNTVAKQIIAVYGTSGSGKSFVSSVVAKRLAKDFNINIALLDMDIQDPSIDIINNIDEKESRFSSIVESVDNFGDIKNDILRYMIKDNKNKNLWYITNNCSLFECQNKLSSKYYQKIYDNKCDFTLVDLPSSPFLDVVPYSLNIASKILFVINANYISIRKAIKYINLITKLWNNDMSKIYLIINKRQQDSLEKKQIESILNGHKIVCTIDYYKEVESYINGGIVDLNIDIDLNLLYKELGLKQKENKKNIFHKIYNMRLKNDY